MTHILTTDATNYQLEESLLALMEGTPLDDIIDAFAGGLRRRAGDILSPTDSEAYRNTAIELESLKGRDFLLSDAAEDTVN